MPTKDPRIGMTIKVDSVRRSFDSLRSLRMTSVLQHVLSWALFPLEGVVS